MILTNWLGRLWSDLCKMANRHGAARRGSRPRVRGSNVSHVSAMVQLLEDRRLLSSVMGNPDVFSASKNDELYVEVINSTVRFRF